MALGRCWLRQFIFSGQRGQIPGRPPATCLLSQEGSHSFTYYTMDGQKIILYHGGRSPDYVVIPTLEYALFT